MALREDRGTSVVVAVAVPPVLILTILGLMALMLPSFRVMQVKIDAVNRVLREQITGIRVVRAFVRDDSERARFDRANTDLTATALRVGRINAMLYPAVILIANASTVAVVWVGGHRIESGAMEIGSITALITYVTQILMAVLMASFVALMAPRAAVCADRILEVLDTEPSVSRAENAVSTLARPLTVELSGVGFSYPGGPTRPCCATSRSGPVRAPRRRSSAAPGPVRPR